MARPIPVTAPVIAAVLPRRSWGDAIGFFEEDMLCKKVLLDLRGEEMNRLELIGCFCVQDDEMTGKRSSERNWDWDLLT